MKNRKLTLNKQTVANLSENKINSIKGGTAPDPTNCSCGNCPSDTSCPVAFTFTFGIANVASFATCVEVSHEKITLELRTNVDPGYYYKLRWSR